MESSLGGGLVSVTPVFCSLSLFPLMLSFLVSTPPVLCTPAHTLFSCSIWRAVFLSLSLEPFPHFLVWAVISTTSKLHLDNADARQSSRPCFRVSLFVACSPLHTHNTTITYLFHYQEDQTLDSVDYWILDYVGTTVSRRIGSSCPEESARPSGADDGRRLCTGQCNAHSSQI
jgi:hypothetical protein